MTQKKKGLFLSQRDPGLKELIKIYKDMETPEGRLAILSTARHIARIEPGIHEIYSQRYKDAAKKLQKEHEGGSE